MQAEVIQNHDSENVRNICKNEAQHRKYRGLKFGGCQAYDHKCLKCLKYISLAYSAAQCPDWQTWHVHRTL